MAARVAAIGLATIVCAVMANMGPTSAGAADGMARSRYLDAVRGCLDRLITAGTDRYGPVATPMLMSVIDVRTGVAPREPELLDAMVRTEERPGRRNPGGSDLWDDMPLLRTMYAVTALSRDPRYKRAADAYARSFMQRSMHRNGLLAWGSHLYYDAYADQVADDGAGRVHETLILHPCWERLWALDRPAVEREIEGMWEWHIVDKATGQHNRHDDRQVGCDFAFWGGTFVSAFAFMAKVTRKPVWLERAKLVAGWHWRHRDPQTGLTVDAPSTGDRYDAHHCFTTVPGPHASHLLRSYELTRDPFFRDVAVTYIKAFLRYGYDEQSARFQAALEPNGRPIPDQAPGRGYDRWMPTGQVDIWPTTMYSYEFPLIAAQTCLYAYDLTKDRELLAGARKWAANIRAEMPPAIGRRWRDETLRLLPEATSTGGAYADGYGRAISFFVRLHRVTRAPEYLAIAEQLADEALLKLGSNGWVRGHPAKPYYESVDGVGTLLYSLVELSHPAKSFGPNL